MYFKILQIRIFHGILLFLFYATVTLGELKLSKEEKIALEKFRPLVKNILVHDYQKLDSYLMRWLKEHHLNVNNAVQALTEAQQWRKENKLDTILNENILDFSDPPANYDSFDNEGRPVIIWTAKKLDVRKHMLNGEKDKLIRYTIQVTEKVGQISREVLNGTGLDSQVTSILDIEGYNLKQHGCLQCLSVYVDWTRFISNYYPGFLAHDVWINVPRIARPVLELIKPVRSPLFQAANKVFGPEKEEWSPYLLSIIPKEQLKFQYGGTKKN